MERKTYSAHLIECFGQFDDVVTVDDDGVEPEGLEAGPVRLHVVLEGRGVALPQPVHVDDGAQVVQLQCHQRCY